MADDALTRTFPKSVHDSLADLRRLAREAKSLQEWRAIGRRATPDEIALAETQRKEHACRATSIRTGLPCTKPRVLGMTTCRKHGGATKHAIARAEQRLREMLDPVLERLYGLAMQDEHKPSAVNAARDLADRVGLGAVVQAKVRASSKQDSGRITVNIGFLNPKASDSEPIVITGTKTEDKD